MMKSNSFIGKIYNTSGDAARIIANNKDEMEIIIECPNCGQPVKYGRVRMISGYIGCDQKIKGTNITCYWDDLMPRVVKAKYDSDKDYGTNRMYRKNRVEENE